jgi:RimJ/RimL family protein N-acetyltransferase
MLIEQARTATAQGEAQADPDDDRVVQLPSDRDEVGDQVKRQRQVGEDEEEDELARARHALVSEQASKEDEAIGDEAGQGSRLASASNGEQDENEERVENEERGEGNEGKAQGRHQCRLVPRTFEFSMLTSIRSASPEDLEPLASLVARANATYTEWAGDRWQPPGAAAERASWQVRLSDAAAWNAVAETGAELRGCISFTDARTEAGEGSKIASLAHLSRMFVAPAHWRAGVGTALLAAATEEMRRRRYARAQLFTAILNTGSRAFYEGHGWQLRSETREWQGLRLIRYTLDL